jgi:hypothetical protein
MAALILVLLCKIYNLTQVAEAGLSGPAGVGTEEGVVYTRTGQTITGLWYWGVSVSHRPTGVKNWVGSWYL